METRRLLGIKYYRLFKYKLFAIYVSYEKENLLIVRPMFDSKSFWEIKLAIFGLSIDFEYHDYTNCLF